VACSPPHACIACRVFSLSLFHLLKVEPFLEKIHHLYGTMVVRHGLMIVGLPDAAKTASLQARRAASWPHQTPRHRPRHRRRHRHTAAASIFFDTRFRTHAHLLCMPGAGYRPRGDGGEGVDGGEARVQPPASHYYHIWTHNPRFYSLSRRVHSHRLNPKAIKLGQLYGNFDPQASQFNGNLTAI